MQVREIMTTDVTVADSDTTLEKIGTMMRAEDIGAVPILDEENELCGIITDRDIVIRCIADGKEANECRAEDILTDDLQTCSPDDDAREAARRMAELQIRRLPVVERNKLVGMLSLGDVAVKLRSDILKGDILEDISQGVKGSGVHDEESMGASADNGQQSSAHGPSSGSKKGGKRPPAN